MPTVQQLGLLAAAVYEEEIRVGAWVVHKRRRAIGASNGFQAAAFVGNGCTVLAFRGTAQAMDAVADLKLGAGMNSTYFAEAEDFATQFEHRANVFVCGHSLGGAIAQVVANRRGFKFVTCNAPGVAVLASRNIGDATLGMTAVRTVGMLVSSVRHPIQTARDVRATFNEVHGLNVCLRNDVVSKVGIHYGDVIRISGTSANPMTEHRMATMNAVLASNAVGKRDVAQF